METTRSRSEKRMLPGLHTPSLSYFRTIRTDINRPRGVNLRSALALSIVSTALCLLLSMRAHGQDGGGYAYGFLSLPFSPRVVGQGGKPAAVLHLPDPSLATANVSLLGPEHANTAYLAHSLHYAGVQYSQAAYFHAFEVGVGGLSFRHALYGNIPSHDALGVPQGYFRAYEMALSMHYSYEFWPGWRAGITLTPLLSQIAHYYSIALAVDAGLSYHSPSYAFVCSLLVRNAGIGLKGYSRGVHEQPPLELLLGLSYTLTHAPLRFFLTLQNMESMRARFSQAEKPRPYYGDGRPKAEQPSLGGKIGREILAHPVVGVEIIPSRYFYLQLAFNAQRFQHMALPGRGYPSGLSWGLGVNYRRFSLNFSETTLHVAGLTHHISVSWRFGENEGRELMPYLPSRAAAPHE